MAQQQPTTSSEVSALPNAAASGPGVGPNHPASVGPSAGPSAASNASAASTLPSTTPIVPDALAGTQLERRSNLPQRSAADAATLSMHNDEQLTIVCKTGAKKNKKNHAVGCKYMHI
jgi:hypothetical protein